MKFLDIAIEVARESGRIQMESLGKAMDIRIKIATDIVTEVDKRCEKMITDRLHREFPTHDMLAEEGSGRRDVSSEYRWIIDPLDGTMNFSKGYPLFATSIALEHKGEVVLGVVYEPNHDELFVAEKGGGASCNGNRIKVSNTTELEKALLDTGFAYNTDKSEQLNNAGHFVDFLSHAGSLRRDGAAAVDLCYVACGRFDGFWELYLKPWDVAAGQLIVKEAGGAVTAFDGSPLDIYGTEILASNGLIHARMMDILCRNREQRAKL